MDYFIDALKNYAVFTGRATRKQYWMFFLVYIGIIFVIAVIEEFIGTAIVSSLVGLALLIPSISIATRRLHDTNRSGWWQLIGILPIIGFIVLIVFFVQDSGEDNQYGPNPKAI